MPIQWPPFINWLTKLLDHPYYIPDMGPSDSHLFGPIKKTFRSRRFVDDDDVTETVHDGLRTQPKVLNKFVEWRANCVQNRVEYVKKKLICNIRKINNEYLWRNCELGLKVSRVFYSVLYIYKIGVCVKVTYMFKTYPYLGDGQTVCFFLLCSSLSLASQLDAEMFFLNPHPLLQGRNSTQVLASELALYSNIPIFLWFKEKVSPQNFSLFNGPLQLVSAAFHLHDQQPVAFPNGGKLFLDGRPLCCSSGDSALLPLQFNSQTPRGCPFINALMSDRKKQTCIC